MSDALMTGAGSGMGQLLARRLAERGADVTALDRDADGLAALQASSPGVTTHVLDVTDVAAVVAAVGDRAWDHVVVAAGIGHTGRIDQTDPSVHRRLMEVNYLGAVNVVTAALPALQAARAGRLTVFASLAGWVPAPEHGPYGATKAALVLWCQALQRELAGTGVGVTCVCPSAVATPLLDDMPAAKRGAKYVRPATPDQIVSKVLAAMDKGRPWVFPREAKALQVLQRFTPGLLDRATRLMLRAT